MKKQLPNNKKTITIKTENGNDLEGKIMFTFDFEEDNYIIYEIGDKAFAAKIDNNNNLISINNDEWDIVEKIFNEYQLEQEREHK